MSDKWQQKIIIRGFKVEIAFICKLLADIELRERERNRELSSSFERDSTESFDWIDEMDNECYL